MNYLDDLKYIGTCHSRWCPWYLPAFIDHITGKPVTALCGNVAWTLDHNFNSLPDQLVIYYNYAWLLPSCKLWCGESGYQLLQLQSAGLSLESAILIWFVVILMMICAGAQLLTVWTESGGRLVAMLGGPLFLAFMSLVVAFSSSEYDSVFYPIVGAMSVAAFSYFFSSFKYSIGVSYELASATALLITMFPIYSLFTGKKTRFYGFEYDVVDQGLTEELKWMVLTLLMIAFLWIIHSSIYRTVTFRASWIAAFRSQTGQQAGAAAEGQAAAAVAGGVQAVEEEGGPAVADEEGPAVADEEGPAVADEEGPAVADEEGPAVADEEGPTVADEEGPAPAVGHVLAGAEGGGPVAVAENVPTVAEEERLAAATGEVPTVAEEGGPAAGGVRTAAEVTQLRNQMWILAGAQGHPTWLTPTGQSFGLYLTVLSLVVTIKIHIYLTLGKYCKEDLILFHISLYGSPIFLALAMFATQISMCIKARRNDEGNITSFRNWLVVDFKFMLQSRRHMEEAFINYRLGRDTLEVEDNNEVKEYGIVFRGKHLVDKKIAAGLWVVEFILFGIAYLGILVCKFIQLLGTYFCQEWCQGSSSFSLSEKIKAYQTICEHCTEVYSQERNLYTRSKGVNHDDLPPSEHEIDETLLSMLRLQRRKHIKLSLVLDNISPTGFKYILAKLMEVLNEEVEV